VKDRSFCARLVIGQRKDHISRIRIIEEQTYLLHKRHEKD
jgi:hypothetical protein